MFTHFRHIRSFCMRRGHISNAQEKALEELLPLYEIPYDANQMFDAVKTFGNNNPLVLEIGCGMGTDTINFARAGARVTAVDLSEESLNLARQRAEV